MPQDDQQDNPNGMNIIEGTNNKNRLKGSNGADKIFGYEGADKIDGKKGDDIIDPGLWKKGKFDVVKGGSGSDTFILKDGYWAYIKDFKIFEDKLDLSGINGGYSWEYWNKQRQTYIFDDNDIELARIKGDVDIDSADVIM
jgi:Ca2+-binding RTX toxin-like protein